MKQKNLSHRAILMIALGGMMVALEVVLERYVGVSTDTNRYSPAFLARAVTGSIFGPWFSAVIGGLADFIGAAIIYGSPNPFLSITAVLRGFFYGFFLKGKINLKRTIAAVLSVEVLCSLLVNTFILHLMYNTDIYATFIKRLPQVGIYIALQIPYILFIGRFLVPELRRIVRGYAEMGKVSETVKSVIKPGSHPGLARVRSFADTIGNPERNLRIIHVAGTNGKGSISNMIASVLKESGLKVGIFNSPYLESPREYFNINGKLASEQRFAAISGELTDIIKQNEGATGFEAPTEFEFYTCAALKYFADKKCDVVVLEAGMGGKEDATNFIQAPELAVITNIGLDHTAYLGETIEEIAAHKAGIIKKGSAVVLYPSNPKALGVLKANCTEKSVIPVVADFGRLNSYGVFGESYATVVDYTTDNNKKYSVRLNTPAIYQARNAAVALEAIEKLKERGFIISDEAVETGMQNFAMPARFEVLHKNPLVIADGGHNPQCLEAVTESLGPVLAGRKAVVLTAVMKDKDYNAMYNIIDPLACEYVTVTADNPRALEASELARFLERYRKPVISSRSVQEGVKTALERAGETGVVLVTGSLYMMDDVRKTLK